jgi:hypothetical protein
LKEKEETHKLKMQKKGEKQLEMEVCPTPFPSMHPKAPRIPPESHPTTQLTLHTLTIMTNIPFTRQTKPTNATISNKSYTTYTKQNNTKAFQPPREQHLLQA